MRAFRTSVGIRPGKPWPGRGWVIVLALGLSANLRAFSADTLAYTVGKIHHFFQFDAGAPVEDAISTWESGVAVYPAVLSPISVLASAYGPAGNPTNGMAFRYNRYERQAYYLGQGALDTALPNGSYTVQIATRNEGTFQCNLTLAGNAYPNPPHLTNYAAAQAVDATQPFLLGWDAFANGSTNDFVFLQIASAPNETPTNYFASPLPGQTGAAIGTNRTFLIQANVLPPGKQLFAKLSFLKVTDTNVTAYPGATGWAGYGATTIMPLQTLPRSGLPLSRALGARASMASGQFRHDDPGACRFRVGLNAG